MTPSGETSGEISPELTHDPYGEEVLDVSRDDFEAMLSEHQSTTGGPIKEGQIVRAKVLRITDTTVILEFGFKSEGAVPLEEFKEPELIEAGQEVEVLLECLEDDDGVVVLSKKKADFLRVWELIREAYEGNQPVKGLLTRKIKGGVTVDIMGVDAFLPGSQIALRRVPNIEELIGKTYDFKIIKLNKRRRNIVVSRRVLLEKDRQKQRAVLVKELLVGQVREGVVKNITDFGAFIDLGGLDGLLHITDMSWGRVGHPSEVVMIGGNLDVKVLDIDWTRERISLGLKQLMPYPWTDIMGRYPVGARVRGKVVSITNYGAFVEIQKGVEGLIHISEMSWTRTVRHPSKLVAIGDELETVVLRVDPKGEKISLGLKQTKEDPWLALSVRCPPGTRLPGTVRNLTSFGAFVEVEDGIDGLVHVSDMSWTKRILHPSEAVRKGEEIEVMILDVDADNKRISLGIKQLQEDPWPELVMKFHVGMETTGTVLRLQDGGVAMELGDEVEGFVLVAQTGVVADKMPEHYRVGESCLVKVVSSEATERRILLEVLELPEHRPVPKPEAVVEELGEGDKDSEAEDEPGVGEGADQEGDATDAGSPDDEVAEAEEVEVGDAVAEDDNDTAAEKAADDKVTKDDPIDEESTADEKPEAAGDTDGGSGTGTTDTDEEKPPTDTEAEKEAQPDNEDDASDTEAEDAKDDSDG